jgi:hypothetical protein
MCDLILRKTALSYVFFFLLLFLLLLALMMQ